jgi:hypothetical protein
MPTCPAFEVSSKRRKGFPSETQVKRGLNRLPGNPPDCPGFRFVRGGEKELVEKLGRNDPCPCGSGQSFQEMLPRLRPVSTGASGRIIGGEGVGSGSAPRSHVRGDGDLMHLVNCHRNSVTVTLLARRRMK